MGQGAWQATVHRVAKSWTWLKRLSTHAHQVSVIEESTLVTLSEERETSIQEALEKALLQRQDKSLLFFLFSKAATGAWLLHKASSIIIGKFHSSRDGEKLSSVKITEMPGNNLNCWEAGHRWSGEEWLRDFRQSRCPNRCGRLVKQTLLQALRSLPALPPGPEAHFLSEQKYFRSPVPL